MAKFVLKSDLLFKINTLSVAILGHSGHQKFYDPICLSHYDSQYFGTPSEENANPFVGVDDGAMLVVVYAPFIVLMHQVHLISFTFHINFVFLCLCLVSCHYF